MSAAIFSSGAFFCSLNGLKIFVSIIYIPPRKRVVAVVALCWQRVFQGDYKKEDYTEEDKTQQHKNNINKCHFIVTNN